MADRIGRIEGDRLEVIGDSAGFSTTDPGIIAIKDLIRDRYCEIAGWAEAGSRALGLGGIANLWARGRANSGCYNGPPPGLTVENPENGYEGGQCPGTLYEVIISWVNSGRGPGSSRQTPRGPVTFIGLGPSPGRPERTAILIKARNLQGEDVTTQVHAAVPPEEIVSWSLDEFNVLSGPDDCGNAPGQGPQYPDGEELPGDPPSPGDRLGGDGDRRIDVEIDGVPTPLDIPETAPEYLGPDGVRVCFGTRCYTITPEGDVWGDEPGSRPTDDPYPPGPDEEREEIKSCLDEILELLKVPIEGDVTVDSCEPDSEVVQPYSGLGMVGIQSMLTAITAAMSIRLLEFCEGDEGMNLVRQLVSGVGPAQKREFFDVPIPQDSLFIDVECSTSFEAYAVSAENQSGVENIQGRFAQVSLLSDDGNDIAVIKTYVQYYSIQRYQVPELSVPVNKVRISLYPGAEASIFVIKEE